MAHLLLLEAPGGNDFDVFDEALAQGHQVTFFTADISHYRKNGTWDAHLARSTRVVELNPFDYASLERSAIEIHSRQPFDAILCLIDIRMPEASRLAGQFKLRFLNYKSAVLLRDKFKVRTRLAEFNICQPEFALATTQQQLKRAVDQMGLPVLIKPCDGYGSQNVVTLLTEDDLHPLLGLLDNYLPGAADYGFGVHASGRLLVERFVSGQLIGCDTFTMDGRHVMLGINEKLMFPAPSSAIRGGCFPSDRFDTHVIRDYVFSVLDALGFDQGAAHTEILVTADGPYLVEVNPRLVGARIPRLLNAALGRSVHLDLINLHLGRLELSAMANASAQFAVSRWLVTERTGTLEALSLPASTEPSIRHVEILKKPGDVISFPFHNADRIGYVMTVGETREAAENMADCYISGIDLVIAQRSSRHSLTA